LNKLSEKKLLFEEMNACFKEKLDSFSLEFKYIIKNSKQKMQEIK